MGLFITPVSQDCKRLVWAAKFTEPSIIHMVSASFLVVIYSLSYTVQHHILRQMNVTLTFFSPSVNEC